jgi:hypothetical protein
MIKKLYNRVKNWDLIDYIHYISIAVIIALNCWMLMMPIPPMEKAAYIFFANFIGFFCIGLPLAYGLLATLFRDRYKEMIKNVISKAIGREYEP